MPKVTVDHVMWDPKNQEYVLYFVEDGPWPSEDDMIPVLRRIQARLYDAIDVAIDGGIAKVFPDSIGKRCRIQLDCPSGTPERVSELVRALQNVISTSEEYVRGVKNSRHISFLRLVTGKEMGRPDWPKSQRN